MLFAQKLLAPGPQAKHPGNVNPVLDTGPPAEPGVYLKEIIKFSPEKRFKEFGPSARRARKGKKQDSSGEFGRLFSKDRL